MPQAAPGQCQNGPGLGAADELLKRSIDRRRVGPLAADPDCLIQQLLIKHKICPFHVYSMYYAHAIHKAARTGRRGRRAHETTAALFALVPGGPAFRLGAAAFHEILGSIERGVLGAELRQRIGFDRIDHLVCGRERSLD